MSENATKNAIIVRSGRPRSRVSLESLMPPTATTMPRQRNDIKDAAIVRHDRSRRDFHRQLLHQTCAADVAGPFNRSKLQNNALKRDYDAKAPLSLDPKEI